MLTKELLLAAPEEKAETCPFHLNSNASHPASQYGNCQPKMCNICSEHFAELHGNRAEQDRNTRKYHDLRRHLALREREGLHYYDPLRKQLRANTLAPDMQNAPQDFEKQQWLRPRQCALFQTQLQPRLVLALPQPEGTFTWIACKLCVQQTHQRRHLQVMFWE